MALTNKQDVWIAQSLAALRSKIVFGAPGITNRDYEGEIRKQGDTVRVVGMVDPTIFEVTPNADIPEPETLTDTEDQMVIDQNYGFNYQVDDLDKLQVVGGGNIMLKSAANAARKLAVKADESIAAKMVAEVEPTHKIGTTNAPIKIDAPQPGTALAADAVYAYNVLVRLGIKLDKADVPEENRWVVIPSFFRGALGLDPRFTSLAPDGSSTLRNGFVGNAAGFRVHTTNALPSLGSSKYQIVAGSPIATSYAEQLANVKFYEPERRIGAQAAKGHHVYGHKTFVPEALAVATVQDVSGLDS